MFAAVTECLAVTFCRHKQLRLIATASSHLIKPLLRSRSLVPIAIHERQCSVREVILWWPKHEMQYDLIFFFLCSATVVHDAGNRAWRCTDCHSFVTNYLMSSNLRKTVLCVGFDAIVVLHTKVV